MKGGLLVVAVCVLAGALSAEVLAAPAGLRTASPTARAGAQSGSGAASDRSVTYTDAVGDNDELAPDIGQIAVSLIAGRLTFRVGIANLGPGLIDDEFVTILIDTDRNAATGCAGGEVALAVLGATSGTEFARRGKCVGGSVQFGVPQGSFTFSNSPGTGLYGPGAVSFSINASELGTTSFRFRVGTTYSGDYDDYFDTAGPFAFTSSSTPANPQAQPSTTKKGLAITRHADARAEATGPTGARVTYPPAKVRGAKTVSYSKRSGTVFPLGRTTVTITARNGARVARSTFAVVVADTTPPTFAPLPGVGTNATEPTRATVTFGPVTATDRVDRSVSVTCSPVSGTVLAPGTTDVTCTARDDAGNTADVVFRVAVPVFTNQMSLQTSTTYQYDGALHLVGATTALTIAVPAAEDGSPVTYAWAATAGTITGTGPTASWARQLDPAGQPVPGNVTVTLTYPSGRTEVLAIQFP